MIREEGRGEGKKKSRSTSPQPLIPRLHNHYLQGGEKNSLLTEIGA